MHLLDILSILSVSGSVTFLPLNYSQKKLMKDVNCSIMGDEFLLDCGAKFQR